ncbi:dihydrodipicolinate reductase, bacterial/plant [Actinidia rufa]|uniref:Dihydrodipicolinate reductase, bacterial/plant n=1 Tax=Actinidia rufa TaxID=165716 RepID=A0A7J0EAZ4_9ERIC|nr:dihydrodipicolinate reductase, bacterial/plant [Actinidia rufa]
MVLLKVNGCTGKMGKAVIEAAVSAGLHLVPVSFSSSEESQKTVQVGGKDIQISCCSVNDNAELYCKIGVPFVMGTTAGDRELLYKTVEDSKVYAVISPQMGKQVVAFIAAMEIMAEQFPGAFSGYSLQVMESHQAFKLDTSGTAKEVIISCFQKLGVSFDLDEIQMIRDPEQQLEMVGVPEEHLSGHAFHLYHLTSPDQTVSFEFQHNVCGRSIYAEGTIDATIFLAQKVRSKAEKRIYNMIDVLREGIAVGLLYYSKLGKVSASELGRDATLTLVELGLAPLPSCHSITSSPPRPDRDVGDMMASYQLGLRGMAGESFSETTPAAVFTIPILQLYPASLRYRSLPPTDVQGRASPLKYLSCYEVGGVKKRLSVCVRVGKGWDELHDGVIVSCLGLGGWRRLSDALPAIYMLVVDKCDMVADYFCREWTKPCAADFHMGDTRLRVS